MNPEIYAILEKMKRKEKIDAIGESEIHRNLSIYNAALLVLLAEETESQSNKAQEQAERVIDLTKALKTLTIVLVIVSLVQIGLMLKSFF